MLTIRDESTPPPCNFFDAKGVVHYHEETEEIYEPFELQPVNARNQCYRGT
jgi:hypothetical protein